MKVEQKVQQRVVIETGDTIEDLLETLREAGHVDQIAFSGRGTLFVDGGRFRPYVSDA